MMTRQIARDDDETNCSLGISFLAVQRAPDFSVRLHAARHRAGGDALSDKVNVDDRVLLGGEHRIAIAERGTPVANLLR